MKISEILTHKQPMLSFEVFPPKKEAQNSDVEAAVDKIAALSPSFMSVTYGAAGGTKNKTVSIASHIQNDLSVTALAHLTCINSSKETIANQVNLLKEHNIQNILALRGDVIPGQKNILSDYEHADQLIADIKKMGDFCIGGACYPETHVESANTMDDMYYLKKKVDTGCDFLTTQMFFDNQIFYTYMYKLRDAGIQIPIIPGIMPVTNAAQLKRIFMLSGTKLPARFKAIIDRFGDNPKAMSQAGIAYATEQIIDLIANGVNAIHVYSMNKPYIAEKISENLSDIIVN